MKGSGILVGLMVMSSLAFAQSGDVNENQGEIKELPAAASHGQTISELARNTPGGPEKGKIISSAAREKGLQNSTGNHANNGQRPAEAGKLGENGRGHSAIAKSSLPPQASAAAKARAVGLRGPR